MSARSIRRATERKALKLARKAGISDQKQEPAPAVEPETILNPSLPPSPARISANRLNARLSTGPTSEAGLALSSQNRALHGLARHGGNFKLLSSEDPNGFEALKQSLVDEHQPSTETESILVNGMAESHWLANRAQRLQDTCMDPDFGTIINEKMLSLYLRYQTTHTRAFHKSLNDLLKIRAEKRKAEIGFEAQTIQKEKHEMKKLSQNWNLLKKDIETHRELSSYILQNLQAERENPGFEAQFAAEVAKRGLEIGEKGVAA